MSVAPQYGKLSILSWAHFLNDGAANYLPGDLARHPRVHGIVYFAGRRADGHTGPGSGTAATERPAADRLGGRSLTVAGLVAEPLPRRWWRSYRAW